MKEPRKTLKARLLERTLRSMTPAERAAAKADARSIPERWRALKAGEKPKGKGPFA